MILCDVNVLLYAHREEFEHHVVWKKWLEGILSGDEPYGCSDFVLSSFLRIATHRRVFDPPTPMRAALKFADEIRDPSNRVLLEPGDRHWEIFSGLCLQPDVKGKLVADAYLAALAIEHGCQFVTNDGDFMRFAPRLKIYRPIAS